MTGPGGTATANATVTVTYLQPTVSISADPVTILAGETATLTWSSTHAESAAIDQGIGAVAVNGTVSVAPTTTTTYTITVTGPGGPASASVTVAVSAPTPTVSVSADPESIPAGASSTLTWSSTHADTVTIDQGIGSVDINGSMTVSPTVTTTYTITASGPGGSASDSVTLTVISPIILEITCPLSGGTISRPDVMVEGTIVNSAGSETGISINGVVAMIYGNQFVANHVLLQEGENTITAVATDENGNTANASIVVSAETTGEYIKITPDTESGVSPLETILTVDGSFEMASVTIYYAGPASVDSFEDLGDNEYRAAMSTKGIYYFTAEVTDDQNNTYTDTVAVQVLDLNELDAMLKAKWNGI